VCRWGARDGNGTGPAGESITKHGDGFEEAGGYKEGTSEGLALLGKSTPLPGL
jgi:hypothetical protein